jgi:hypothetical protein
MKRLLLALVIMIAVASGARALVVGTDLYLPSVAHGQGQCPGGICSQWRSDVWIYNPSTTAVATVQMYFLYRDQENLSPPSQTLTVAPGETRELLDVVLTVFGLDGPNGALRVVSDIDVVVTGRIYDENVQTNKGAGTAGMFLAGLPAGMAIGSGEATDLIGLAQDAAEISRTNFGFLETSGAPVSVEVTKRDAAGATLASRSYQLGAREVIQRSIAEVGGPLGTNQRLAVRVTGGSGQVLAFASRMDNRTGDPSSVEMWMAAAGPAHTTGMFHGTVWDSTGTLLDGTLELSVSEVGIVAYEGLAGIPCGVSDSYVLDFSDLPATPVEIVGGDFTATVTIPYSDGSSTVFTTVWTLEGTIGSDGVITGTLRSDTSGGTGSWAACNATNVSRAWCAGWTASLWLPANGTVRATRTLGPR